MAIVPQDYPRDEKGLLDASRIAPHTHKLPVSELKSIIRQSITKANKKSSRVILDIPPAASDEEKQKIYQRKGRELFEYFRKYYGDPATTAYDCFGRHYSEVGREQFHNQTLQKERMNTGWRYQFIAKECAAKSQRFSTVSDIGAAEADFNVTVDITENARTLNIYVSVKNRMNTMGGQDWPKAIYALEDIARSDKNRSGPYICVFGIVIEKGQRLIKRSAKTKSAHSVNTEVWLPDFFWPFFSNYTYREIARAVLDVLVEESERTKPGSITDAPLIPDELIAEFGEQCRRHDLVDENGNFHDAGKLVDVFCNSKE